MFNRTFNRRYLILYSASLGLALLFYASNGALAKNSSIKASISETAVMDTNPLMVERNAFTIWGTETRATLGYDKETRNKNSKSSISVIRNQFNRSKFSSTDVHGLSNLKLDLNRWQIELGGKVGYETTRTSELTTFDFNVGATHRTSYSITPSISYNISPRSIMSLSGVFTDKYYDDSSYTDYRTYSVSPALAYNITPLQQIQMSFLFNRYQSLDGAERTVDTTGPSLGWSYYFRPYLSLKLSGSLLTSKYKGYAGLEDENDATPTFSSILNYEGRRNNLMLSVIKARQSYGNGTESYLTSFVLQDRYKVSKFFLLDFKADYQDAQLPSSSTSGLDSTWNISAGAKYILSRNWNLNTSFKYREEELIENSDSTNQSVLRVGLSYNYN